jgi:hypothetical protein
MLARTAAIQRYDLTTLKEAIRNDIRANIRVAHNREATPIEKISSYLQTVFNLSRLDEEELWVLKQFA